MAVSSISVSRPYAKAALALAGDDMENWLAPMQELAQAVAAPKVSEYLRNPVYDKEDKTKKLLSICSAAVPVKLKHLVVLLVQKQRVYVMGELYQHFVRLVNAKSNISYVQVVTATAVAKEQKSSIEEVVAIHFTGELVWSYAIDTSIIGGFLASSGDKVIDATVKRRIERLAAAIGSNTER